MWKYRGKGRPDFAAEPQSGQESVWDYPRPPAIQQDSRKVVVKAGGIEIAASGNAVRMLETASPPVFNLPPADIKLEYLRSAAGGSMCEWKGVATYYDIIIKETVIPKAAWAYLKPFEGYESIAEYLSFFPGKVKCYVGDEEVKPQEGNFYGGWVTKEIVGPWKGDPGTGNW